MITVKLESGKELTLEEVKEVVDKFQGMLGKKETPPLYEELKKYFDESPPPQVYPPGYFSPPFFPTWPGYGPQIVWGLGL